MPCHLSWRFLRQALFILLLLIWFRTCIEVGMKSALMQLILVLAGIGTIAVFQLVH